MTGKHRYECTVCGYRDKWIPGRQSELERSIRTGCKQCGTIQKFKRVGAL